MEELSCNISECGVKLTNTAWATSCFHIFCNDCAVKEFNETSFCPICKTKFLDKLDIKCVDVQPSEKAKSMMMIGLKPETIMEISQRGFSFWSCQIANKINNLESYIRALKEQKNQFEQVYKHFVSQAENTISGFKHQNEELKKELEFQRHKNAEFADKLMDKERYINKLQGMYETTRRRMISSHQSDEKDVGFIPKFINNNLEGCQSRVQDPVRALKVPDDLTMAFCCLNENVFGTKNSDCQRPKLF